MDEIDQKDLSWPALLKWAGQDWVRKNLPPPFTAWVQPHSTGYQASIHAKEDGLPDIEVWRHSEWYSHIYEFNEQGRTRGWQQNCEWAKPAIEKFFDGLRGKRIEAHRQGEMAKAERAADDARLMAEARAKYAAAAARAAS
jgi:hypothetical protein